MSERAELWKLSLTFPENYYEVIVAALSDCGVDSFEDLENSSGISFITADATLPATIGVTIREFLERIEVAPEVVVLNLEPFTDSSWQTVWKNFWEPVRISNSLVVCPSWCQYAAEENETVVFIDTTLAFGTGTHPTTRICLALIEELLRDHPLQSFLDVGCGSGVLSIAAAKLGVSKVRGLDISNDICETAQTNAAFNGLSGLVFDTAPISKCDEYYDLVCANILSSIIVENWPAIRRAVAAGGKLILSGILEGEVESVISHLRLSPLSVRVEEGWAGILLSADRR